MMTDNATAVTDDLPLSTRVAGALVARIALGTAAAVGVAFGGVSAAWAGLEHQAKLATQRIGLVGVAPPERDGTYLPDGRCRRPTSADRRSALRLVMLGDSTSAGVGAVDPDGVPGVMLARAVAAELGRPVQLITFAVVGSGAADLQRQVSLAELEHPDVAVIVVGSNDVRDRVSPAVCVSQLADAVRQLRASSIAVVVGTCPDLGVIAPIPQPLRQLAGHWSRSMARRQESAVARVGGIAVPVHRLVSPEFLQHPELFSADRFHPSGAGYARAVAALLPAALQALRHESIPASAHRDAQRIS